MITKRGEIMEKRGLSQETLKIIACLTMLLDHIGAVAIPSLGLRVIGRLAFPIYCFLLAEGAYYTRSRKAYGLRLLIGLLLSEIPFDFLFFGEWTFAHQSVMVTLLLGFLYAVSMNYLPVTGYRILLIFPFAMVAELLNCDYGGWGVAMTAMFVVTRESRYKWLFRIFWLAILSVMIGGMSISIGPVRIPIQLFSLAALVPIWLYDGRKITDKIWIRQGFYLFYPVHLALLYLVVRL